MITEDLGSLQIHKLTQDQYDAALAAGELDENAIYLTEDDSGGVPDCTTDDNGKFLRVVDGVATWAALESAEGVSF